jgi:signal transduction histidine kinase
MPCAPADPAVSVGHCGPRLGRLASVKTARFVPAGDRPAADPAGKDLLWFVAEGTAGTVGEEFFRRLVEHLALAFGADVAFVAELVPEARERARFLACWEGGRLVEPAEYRLAGTPCAEVGRSDVVSYAEGVRRRFPDDEMVVRLGLDSYLAVALRGADGGHLGHIGVLAAGRLTPDPEKVAALRIFAARAAAEVERRRHERALHEREATYRALADEQAALRRVAMLVAAGAPQRELLESVACEVGRLFSADVASLVRCDGERAEIVAGWNASPARPVRTGHVFDVETSFVTKTALRTGRPARGDERQLRDEVVRELGIRSAVAAPIDVAGRRWGVVRAGRTGEEPLPAGAETRLGDFAGLVAQAIANAEARQELTASRSRIVEAGDAARRRIERNLHDGAQQRLVGLSLSLRLAQRRLEGDPRASRLLAGLAEDVAEALRELRELARGIHPAVLTDRGLGPALEALAARAPLPVELRTTPRERLPEPVEATAYYIVAEALTNVAKYAGATVATVSVEHPDGRLRVAVADDGIGGADMTRGSGLRGLADRAEALRGTLRVESAAGRGTTVIAELPVGGT